MVAISEVPQLWRRSIQRWRFVNRRWKKRIDEVDAPDDNEEYLLYQTLLGTWPIDQSGGAEKIAGAKYVERIQSYMAKALNEAKLNTSWIQPNEEWLAAMREFAAKILEPSVKNKFLPTFFPLVEEIARLGAINSLTQTLLKLSSPGVPDIYQGNEIWDFSLVDPDNRRIVNYKRRREMLDALCATKPEELLQSWPDGRIKMFLTQRLLQFRNEHVDLFKRGNYSPVLGKGAFADCCVSFVRQLEDQWIVVIAPRFSSRLGFPPLGDKWKDTIVDLPETLSMNSAREIFTGREVRMKNRQLHLVNTMSILPFAAITNL